MHIPKTAGTSLRYLFYKNFGEDNCYPNTKTIKKCNNNYPPIKYILKEKKEILKHDLFIGHYPYLVSDKIYPFYNNIFKIAFLRDPLERSLSLIQHFKNNNAKFKKKPIEKILEDKNFVNTQLLNTQTYFFSAKNSNIKDIENNINISTAKKNLNKFQFIGFVESYEKSILKLADILSLKKIMFNKMNQKKRNINFDNKIISKIFPLIKLDIELYNYAYIRYKRTYK